MNRRNRYTEEDILKEAKLLVSTPGGSTYTVASHLGRSQSTVWNHMTNILPNLDYGLFLMVKEVLRRNHKGGGKIKRRG